MTNTGVVVGTYESRSMQLAFAATGLILFATTAQADSQMISEALAGRLTRNGATGVRGLHADMGWSALRLYGLDCSLIPKWLPPSQVFWGSVTGVCFIAAGLAILTGIKARLAAILLTIMIATFGVLANGRMLVADDSNHWNWTESTLKALTVPDLGL